MLWLLSDTSVVNKAAFGFVEKQKKSFLNRSLKAYKGSQCYLITKQKETYHVHPSNCITINKQRTRYMKVYHQLEQVCWHRQVLFHLVWFQMFVCLCLSLLCRPWTYERLCYQHVTSDLHVESCHHHPHNPESNDSWVI